MIELDKANPPQHFDFTPKELLQRLANTPNLKFGWGELLFLKGILEQAIEGQMEVADKNGSIRITLYQPTDTDVTFLKS